MSGISVINSVLDLLKILMLMRSFEVRSVDQLALAASVAHAVSLGFHHSVATTRRPGLGGAERKERMD